MTRRRSTTVVAAAIAAIAAPALTATTTHAQDAVQWRVEDGGNGHWYQAVSSPSIEWPQSVEESIARGGHLATAVTMDENRFLAEVVDVSEVGPGWWIGGVFNTDQASWSWITGEEWSFTSWGNSELGCGVQQPDGRDALDIYCIDSNGDPRWSDDFFEWTNALGFVVEWSADCNGDGIVDYGQILDGTFADCNRNGVPDLCDLCPGGDDSADGDYDTIPDACDLCSGFDDLAVGNGQC